MPKGEYVWAVGGLIANWRLDENLSLNLTPNSPAAGAIVDNTTISRARAIGLDPEGFLSRSDSYSFFVALGDVITTGPTGTNVRDLRILLTTLTQ